jgi:hypothetical protein
MLNPLKKELGEIKFVKTGLTGIQRQGDGPTSKRNV